MKISIHTKNGAITIVALFLILGSSLVSNAAFIQQHTQHPVQAKVELTVNITKPMKGHLYINNIDQGNTATGVTRIIGSITIEAIVFGGDGGIDRVEFFIDGIKRNTTKAPPYAWFWNDSHVGAATIKVKAYDKAGNESERSLDVRALMIHTLVIDALAAAKLLMMRYGACVVPNSFFKKP